MKCEGRFFRVPLAESVAVTALVVFYAFAVFPVWPKRAFAVVAALFVLLAVGAFGFLVQGRGIKKSGKGPGTKKRNDTKGLNGAPFWGTRSVWARFPILRVFLGVALGACVGVFGSRMYGERTKSPVSLFELVSVTALYGTVRTSPVLTESGTYRITLVTEKAYRGGVVSGSVGTVSVCLPSAIVEKCYPGKLSTGEKSFPPIPIDSGARLWVKGRFSCTGEDAEKTGSGFVKLGARAVQTSADFAKLGAGAVQAGTDSVKTSADFVKLGADRERASADFEKSSAGGNGSGKKSRGGQTDSQSGTFYCERAAHYGWVNSFYKARSDLRLFLRKLTYRWGNKGGLLFALVTGSKEYIDADLIHLFRAAALSHVLALSGIHMSVIASIVLLCTRFLCPKRVARVLLCVCCLLFVALAGDTPSLVRAVLAVCVTVLLTGFGIRVDAQKALAFSFTVQLCLAPDTALSASFLLSYGAVFGLLCALTVYKNVCRVLKEKRRTLRAGRGKRESERERTAKPTGLENERQPTGRERESKPNVLIAKQHPSTRALRSLFSVEYLVRFIKRIHDYGAKAFVASVGAVTFTIPFTLYFFDTVSFVGIFSSIVAIPLVTLFFIFGIFAILCTAVFPFGEVAFDAVLQVLYRAICAVVRFFA